MDSRRKVVILGSTGSIGSSSYKVLNELKSKFQVVGLAAAGGNVEKLAEMANDLACPNVVVANPASLEKLRSLLPDCHCRAGEAAIADLAVESGADIMLCAIVGTAGVLPVMRALENHIPVALASKEVLVMAGEMVMAACRKYRTPIIPGDSEHSAIFQCLQNCRQADEVKNLILTASGGAFINLSAEQLRRVDFKAALQHPVWKMGPKVTIDSASLMNKALEMIEAHHLFNVPENKIKVVIHRQSVIHSMVELVDGALLAQMSVPDMRFAIQYALSYPQRLDGGLPKFDFAKLGQISFELPDEVKYPALNLSRQAMRIGGTMPTVLNAANEVAVERFKQGAVRFPDIWKIVDETMEKHHAVTLDTLECALEADRWARKIAYGIEFRA